jgi:hypothetical protein
LFLNAHQNPTLMPLVQNDRGPIHFLVLHEKYADGTKTMKAGGTKTVYSWDADKGGMSQKTETVKNHSEVLKNTTY